MHNVHTRLENTHMLATWKVVLAIDFTEDYEIHNCN